jgi:hypothetical protein
VALGEDLKSVLTRGGHSREDLMNVGLGDVFMEKIRHAVHEHHSWSSPSQRDSEAFWPELQIESMLVRMSGHPSEPFSESFGVAMSTARADLCAARDRIPS